MACGKPPEHDADHGEADERSDGGGIAFEVARQTAVAADPCERPLDDPAFWQNLKSGNVRSLDDLQSPSTGSPYGQCHLASGISAISKNVFDEREQSSGSAQQMESTITILNVGRMNDDIQQDKRGAPRLLGTEPLGSQTEGIVWGSALPALGSHSRFKRPL